MAPNDDTARPIGGTWNYAFTCNGCEPTMRRAYFKTGLGSTLKVNVALVSQDDIASYDDADLQEVLGHFVRIYGLNGITVNLANYMRTNSSDTIVSETDAGGIPGPPVAGTPNSGVTVATLGDLADASVDDKKTMGVTAATLREIGSEEAMRLVGEAEARGAVPAGR